MNHNIVAIRSAQSARNAERSCGGCGAGPLEACDPTCPRAPEPAKTFRRRLLDWLGFSSAVTAVSLSAMGGMTLLGMWHW